VQNNIYRRTMKKIKEVIPPRSIVELIKVGEPPHLWKKDLGTKYEIGYYSKNDGLDVVWLLKINTDHRETVDQDAIRKYFKIIYLSDEKEYY